jgi:hypothetical protein
MRSLFTAVAFLFLLSPTGSSNLPSGCKAPGPGEKMGVCHLHNVDIPFVDGAGQEMFVEMRVGDHEEVSALFDTGSSTVDINVPATPDELKGAAQITFGSPGGDVTEPVNDVPVCVLVTFSKKDKDALLCMVTLTSFNPNNSEPLFGDSFTSEFSVVSIDRLNRLVHLSGRTSDKHLGLLMDGVWYKVFLGDKQ